jgi:RND superfamily putative drug exporter
MRLAERYARFIVGLRWLILPLMGAITWAALTMLPGVAAAGGGLSSVIGAGEPAIQAQLAAIQRFGLPLLTGTAVVQRDPAGLDPLTNRRAVARALEIDQRTLTTGLQPSRDLFAALPLINDPRLVPAAREHNTTIVTYLFADPRLGLGGQDRVAREYAADIDQPGNAVVGVAGTIPTQVEERRILERRLQLVEVATLAVIALIVGLTFRSVVAPLVTLVTAAVGYLLADRVTGWLAGAAGLTVPVEIEPILIALMLGIITDYSIFFLSGVRRRLRAGQPNPGATREAVAEYLAIVLTAGFTVAAGVAALVVAESKLFHAFGPGLAVTVLVGLAVAVVLVPALLGVLSRWAFWPAGLTVGPATGAEVGRAVVSEPVAEDAAPVPRSRLKYLGNRWVAALVAIGVIAVLLVAARPVTQLRSAVSPVAALPAGNPVREAAAAASAGFAPGILSPTGVVVAAPGITDRREALAALAAQLQRQPGVAVVLGPNDQLPIQGLLPEQLGLFLAPGGGAARLLVVFDSDPHAATTLGHLRQLRAAMPGLLASAGLAGAEVSYVGDTATGLSLVERARADLVRVAIAVGLVNLLLLMLFLRALIAPLYLLASTVLAVGAAMGLTVALFQGLLGQDGLIFYIPFAAGVLLVSLGSDYTIFSVGYVWDEARRRPLPQALAVAVPRSTRAITAAGVTLAASFALAALIPLTPFFQLAFMMALGVLIDAFLVRSLLVPALISVVGRASGWPGKRLAKRSRGIGGAHLLPAADKPQVHKHP